MLLIALLAGCGQKSTTNPNKVAHVTVTPATLSMVAGDVTSVSVSAENSSNGAVTATFTFSSSNTKIATVAPNGSVCGGVWDSLFVVCNGNDSLGNPITGNATITVTSQGITSGPVAVSVHPSVTSITVDPITPSTACSSVADTHQFVAHAFHNATDITSLVGDFTWIPTDSSVVSIDANGLAKASGPGVAGIIARLGSTTSPATNFKTCMPVLIVLHINGDPAGVPTESVTLNTTETRVIQADMVDELGKVTPNAPVTILSNNPQVASLAGTTLTGVSPGGAGLMAVCAPPGCGNGINQPVYSNLFRVSVNGTSPATTVYAASSFPPPINTTIPLIPIDTSKTPPVAGTAIALNGTPNSMIFTLAGDRAYIGSAVGLLVLDTSANTVSVATPIAVGKVLAVSPDGNTAIVSNAPTEPVVPNQRVWVFNRSSNTVSTFVLAGAISGAFDNDSFRAYIGADNGNVYVFSPFLSTLTLTPGGSSTGVAPLASGPFTYFANSTGMTAFSTCDNSLQASPPTTSTPLLIGTVKNADQIIALNATGLDVETVTVTQPGSGFCPANVSYSNQFIDFGQGAFAAHQLLVATNGSKVVVLPVGIPKIFEAIPGGGPGFISLPAAATEPLSGGLTLDGATLWVGVGGANTVDRIDLLGSTDNLQIPMSFKKSDGSPAPPDIVGVKPK
jgi:hypothetical protein